MKRTARNTKGARKRPDAFADDPIFALIEAHKAAWPDAQKSGPDGSMTRLYRKEERALARVISTTPTTVAGIWTLLHYLQDVMAKKFPVDTAANNELPFHCSIPEHRKPGATLLGRLADAISAAMDDDIFLHDLARDFAAAFAASEQVKEDGKWQPLWAEAEKIGKRLFRMPANSVDGLVKKLGVLAALEPDNDIQSDDWRHIVADLRRLGKAVA